MFFKKKMHESVLRDYFLGKTTAAKLHADVKGSTEQVSDVESVAHIEDMDEHFQVKPEMLIRLCDDVLAEKFPPQLLADIGFALVASDYFDFDSDVEPTMVEVINDWACPEVNYPLTIANVERSRQWLSGAEPYPEKPQVAESGKTRVISIKRKD